VLDRPARNFKDGGFSFGNTADAILNTISHGIPGTPMPAFAESLDEGQRHLLAAYVRTLGPPVEDVDVEDTILHVTEETGPLIVRGILPPIVDGAPIRPRGMLVGLPGGLTFEYRIDDVRLLGVRQGGFVERTDWNDRGGTPLKPLGGLIWTDSGGTPPATFTVDGGVGLQQRLVATRGSTVRSTLSLDDGTSVADVEETIEVVSRRTVDGFSRRFLVSNFSPDHRHESLRIHVPTPDQAELVESIDPTIDRPNDEWVPVVTWRVFKRQDGVYECMGLLLATKKNSGPMPEVQGALGRPEVEIRIPDNSPPFFRMSMVTTVTVFSTNWSPETRAELLDMIH
jgi:hypothetical protein